jgi:hypothetical protein
MDEMGWAHGMHGEDEMCIQNFSQKSWTEGTMWGADGKVLLIWILKNRIWGVDCINMAQDRDQWQALLSMVMNIQVP